MDQRRKAIYISFVVGVLLFAAKVIAYLLTGSNAIFSDAAESVVNIFATGMAVYSIILSLKPADKNHLYGHGNVEFFAAGLEGTMIVLAALVIFYNSIQRIINGGELQQLGWGTLIIAGAGAINLLLGLYLIRKGKETSSITLVADGKHILTDSFTSVGIVLGLLIVMWTGIEIIDPIIAIIVAINIIVTGYFLIRQSVSGLMLETDDELLEEISKILIGKRESFWIDLHELRFWKSANDVFIDFHLILPYYFTIKESHRTEELIRDAIKEKIPTAQIKIHIDFCTSDLCKYCKFKECNVRKENFSEDVKWNSLKLIGKPAFRGFHDDDN
ncbi:MAG: cation transporter [Chlorobi bacterium]|nr:cation transporter [Chlorobiota bacterium]